MKQLILLILFFNTGLFCQDEILTNKQIPDSFKTEISRLEKLNNQLGKKILSQNLKIDTLISRLDENEKLLLNIEDALHINTSNLQVIKNETYNKIQNINESISRQTLYWIIGILFALLLSIIIFLFLKKKLAKNKKNFDSQIEETKKYFESEAIKLDTKLIELLEKQLKISVIDRSTKDENTNVTDHSLAKRVGEEIHRMRNRIASFPQDIKGLVPLKKSLERLESQFNEDGYELLDLIGRPFADGLAVKAIFIPSDDLLKDERKITKVIKPQINFKGQIIQESEIEVSVGN